MRLRCANVCSLCSGGHEVKVQNFYDLPDQDFQSYVDEGPSEADYFGTADYIELCELYNDLETAKEIEQGGF